MMARLLRFLRGGLLALVIAAIAMLGLRIWETERGPPLQPWHTYVPADMHAGDIDKADWNTYLKREEAIFRDVRREVVDRIDEAQRVAGNRYFAGASIYPGNFRQISIVHTSSSPTGRRPAPWCCSTA